MFFSQRKAQKWVKKTIKKNLSTQTPINSDNFIHPTDHAALEALKKIPLFDTLCNKLLKILGELNYSIENKATHIQITEQQLPEIHQMVKSICVKLNIEMPELYLKLDRDPNAYTFGSDKHFIVIHSGLLECLEVDELYAVLAHECGHIACKHVLYHTVGRLILNGGSYGLSKIDTLLNSTLIGSLLKETAITSLELAYHHWNRCSELSADRVAVLCCEDADPVIESMMRLAGGVASIPYEVNRDLFLQQAIEYKDKVDHKKSAKILEFLKTGRNTHPLLAVRAYEAKEFYHSEKYTSYFHPEAIASESINTPESLPKPVSET